MKDIYFELCKVMQNPWSGVISVLNSVSSSGLWTSLSFITCGCSEANLEWITHSCQGTETSHRWRKGEPGTVSLDRVFNPSSLGPLYRGVSFSLRIHSVKGDFISRWLMVLWLALWVEAWLMCSWTGEGTQEITRYPRLFWQVYLIQCCRKGTTPLHVSYRTMSLAWLCHGSLEETTPLKSLLSSKNTF